MLLTVRHALALCCTALAVIACQPHSKSDGNVVAEVAATNVLNTEISPVAAEMSFDSAVWFPALNGLAIHRVLASRQHGIWLVNKEGKMLAQREGRFDALTLHTFSPEHQLLATFDRLRQQLMITTLKNSAPFFGESQYLPIRDFGVEAVCLFQDPQRLFYAFIIGEEGRGEQWLVAHNDQVLTTPRMIRSLSLPPAATHCAVDDVSQQLFVNEENVGVWVYPAHPETDLQRQAVSLIAASKSLSSVAGLAIVPGGLLVLSPDDARLHLLANNNGDWDSVEVKIIDRTTAPEDISVQWHNNSAQLLIRDDDTSALVTASLSWQRENAALDVIDEVLPTQQTELSMAHGDAADDPAIWTHPKNVSESRILATDKKFGLLVFDLNGKRLQEIASGDLNNVDVRQSMRVGQKTVGVAVASNRTHNSVTVYQIDAQTGKVSEWANVATPLPAIYGICLYSPNADDVQVIVNDKSGRFLQYQLRVANDALSLHLLREFSVNSQPEACVADDRRQQLYVGEEDVGVWTLSADPAQAASLSPVIQVGGQLVADVEGIGFYDSDQQRYLVISSQGNDSYLVLDAAPPFALKGRFRIGLNVELGIDGASETDGLDVTSANLGGAFSEGMLVVQDGRKRLPQDKQNFKYVPWRDIHHALKLP